MKGRHISKKTQKKLIKQSQTIKLEGFITFIKKVFSEIWKKIVNFFNWLIKTHPELVNQGAINVGNSQAG